MKRDEFYYIPRPNESSPWDIEILGAGQSNIGPISPTHSKYTLPAITFIGIKVGR